MQTINGSTPEGFAAWSRVRDRLVQWVADEYPRSFARYPRTTWEADISNILGGTLHNAHTEETLYRDGLANCRRELRLVD